MRYCNGRNKGTRANGKPKVDIGPWAGVGYCKHPVGWGVPEASDGRCKRHGGASLRGAAHPGAKHLRRSKYIPQWLADDYEASLRRADQLALDEQIAALDARIAEVFRGMPEGAGTDLWIEAKEAQRKFEAAVVNQDRTAMAAAQAELRTALLRGAEYTSSWEDVCRLGELRRKLVRTEAATRAATEQNVTRARLASLLVFLAQGIQRAISENVSSEKERRRALTQVANFVSRLALTPGQEIVGVHVEEEEED
jgi:hypothetical protein